MRSGRRWIKAAHWRTRRRRKTACSAFRPFSLVVPLTYASDALHSIMLRGWGVGQVQVAVDVLVLLAYDALTLLGAAVFVRRQA